MARTVADPPSAVLMGAPNEDVFAHLRGLSAHSDIVTPLWAAVKSLPGVEVHCSNRDRFGYVTASVAGTVFAFAAGMQGLAFRLSPAHAHAARTRGASPVASLGPEWVFLSLFGDSGFLDSLDEFARQAFTYAQAAGADSRGLRG